MSTLDEQARHVDSTGQTWLADGSLATVVRFFVPGIPVPGGSKRPFLYTPKGGGEKRVALSDDSGQRGKHWRSAVQAAARTVYAGPLLEGPLRVIVTFASLRPTSGKARQRPYPSVRPDATKLMRALEDALTGVVWRDDAQIVDQHVAKRYADRPGAAVCIECL